MSAGITGGGQLGPGAQSPGPNGDGFFQGWADSLAHTKDGEGQISGHGLAFLCPSPSQSPLWIFTALMGLIHELTEEDQTVATNLSFSIFGVS